jgi:hypothetical protein
VARRRLSKGACADGGGRVAGRLRALTLLDVDADGVEQALALVAAELGRT